MRSGIGGGDEPDDGLFEIEGAGHMLVMPKELDLHEVETINIDQSQGAAVPGKVLAITHNILSRGP